MADLEWVPPTKIGRMVARTLKIDAGHGIEGIMKDVERPGKRKPLTLAEVRDAYEPLSEKYPPTLNLDLAAEITGYKKTTLKKKVSEGEFPDCVARGKPLLFWRDRLVLAVMNRPWTPSTKPAIADKADNNIAGDGGRHEAH